MNKALIFDMDGVVINNAKYHLRAWQVFAEKHGKLVSDDKVRSWFGNTNPMILKSLLERELNQEEIRQYSNEKEIIYREIYENDILAVNGLREFLELARKAGYKIGLATAAPPENVEFVLEKTGLRNCFDQITDDTQITNGKPNPEIFLKTAEKLKVNPRDTIVFEDSHHGIEAARRAGMKVIGLTTTFPQESLKQTNLVIWDFREMDLEVLNRLWNDTE